jgi:heparan-alpha-glucosaminide N-acetyltransferase
VNKTPENPPTAPARVISVDALRGFVMFTMIFVNDLAGAPKAIVPSWMRHFHGKDGMTFVDLVFPAFLFIVGMSIPFAFGSRLAKGEPITTTLRHVVVRTLALLLVGIMMVNESPAPATMGWSANLWSTLLYVAAILAFCTISLPIGPAGSASVSVSRRSNRISLVLRSIGFATLAFLAFSFRGADGHRIITLAPFSIHTEWYGILGLIGWAYLVGSIVFVLFHGQRTALLGSLVLLLCLYAADRGGAFQNLWLSQYIGIGGTLGSLPSITVAGSLLGSILVGPDMTSVRSRTRFAMLFIAGFATAALLLHGQFEINKNSATPPWCLWSCAITATLWLLSYYFSDVHPVNFLVKPLALAGKNVLLAYLLSEMLGSALELAGLGTWYDSLPRFGLASAITRSTACGILILAVSAAFNRIGFRLKL